MTSQTTVQWLIEQTAIDGMYYLAGSNGASNPIVGINIMDNPDTVPWLKKNELILSTGYLFSSTSLYKHIIADLHKQGCAGLGIKMNRYLDELPSEMIVQADELAFPIFCIPFDSTMEEITTLVYHNLFHAEITETQRIATSYKNIAEAALKRHSLPPLLNSIATAINSAVFLTNNDFEIIEYAIPKQSTLAPPLPFVHEYNILFSSNDIVAIKALQANGLLPVYEYEIDDHNKTYHFWIFPITNPKSPTRFLIFLQESHEFTSSDFDFIFNIIPLINVALLNNNLFSEELRSNRYLFYSSIFSGQLQNEAEIESLCIQNGFNYKRYRVCVTLRMDNYEELTIAKRRTFERKAFDCIQSLLDEIPLNHARVVYDLDFVLFIFFSACPTQHEISQTTKKIISDITHHLSQIDITCKAGISQCYRGSNTLQKGYLQAVNALELGQKLNSFDNIFSYYENYIFHLLSASLSHEKMYETYHETLGPIIGDDHKNGNELFKTLTTFIEHSLNTSQTANALYIHRNTMSYRIEQIEKLLNIELRDMKNIFRLQLAIYIKQLLDL